MKWCLAPGEGLKGTVKVPDLDAFSAMRAYSHAQIRELQADADFVGIQLFRKWSDSTAADNDDLVVAVGKNDDGR